MSDCLHEDDCTFFTKAVAEAQPKKPQTAGEEWASAFGSMITGGSGIKDCPLWAAGLQHFCSSSCQNCRPVLAKIYDIALASKEAPEPTPKSEESEFQGAARAYLAPLDASVPWSWIEITHPKTLPALRVFWNTRGRLDAELAGLPGWNSRAHRISKLNEPDC